MLINEDLAKKLAERVLDICMEIVEDVHVFLGTHDICKLKSYFRFPVSEVDHFKTNDLFDDVKEQVDYFKYNIPKYSLKEIPEDVSNYDAIFNGYQSDKIIIQEYESYKKFIGWVEEKQEVKMLFEKHKNSDYKHILRNMIEDCIERYLFVVKATSDVPVDEKEKMMNIVEEHLRYFLENELYIDICVPVCLALFEEDNIVLSEKVEIVRMTDAFQMSRQKACTYEAHGEDWVAACATHMIIFHDYFYTNDCEFSLNTATQDYNLYPLQEIDKVFGIIRLVTGYSLGYEQVLTIPLEWVYKTCADLPVVYGAKAHFVHQKEIKKYWMEIQVSVINKDQCLKIKELYQKFLICEEKIQFALSRFNRCMLRDEIDDMSTDACIGLESLLAGGTKGEITYTISNRIPIVFANCKESGLYSANNCRMLMKKIYNFRSKIVHGGKLKENDKYVEINNAKLFVPKVAVDFLKYVLIFMIENPEYLDVVKMDSFIDEVIGESMIRKFK